MLMHDSLLTTAETDASVELYTHPGWAQPSVILTIQGTTLPSEVVVIGAHLDSINSSNPSGGRAPGSDDDASEAETSVVTTAQPTTTIPPTWRG